MPVRWRWGALVLLAAGCGPDRNEPGGPFRSGDVLRPRLHLPEPWSAGKVTALGAYVEVLRPGRTEPYDLLDVHAPEGLIRLTGTVRFFAGDAPLGDATALPFAHECRGDGRFAASVEAVHVPAGATRAELELTVVTDVVGAHAEPVRVAVPVGPAP